MPKYDYKPLKDIEKKVNNVMDKRHIQPYNSIAQAIQGKQNFFVTDTAYRNSRVMFKARIADHRVLRQKGKNFKNERRFLRSLQKVDPENPITTCMPRYLKSQMTSCEWLMCEFIDKKTIGSSNISYDSPTDEEILKIVKLLRNIQIFPIQKFCRTHHWTKSFQWNDFNFYHELFHKVLRTKRPTLQKILTKEEIDLADEIILDNQPLLDGACTLLSHGDFHPANIIINGNAIAIDWETLHIDNAAWDLATLWMRMVGHQEERRLLLQEFAKKTQQKEYFPDLFRLNILCRMFEEIAMIWHPLSHRDDLPDWKLKLYSKNLEISKENFKTAIKGGSLNDYD